MLLQVIMQSGSGTESGISQTYTYPTPNSREIGFYANLVSPRSIWYNGSTYIMGNNTSDDNNSPFILQYKNGSITYEFVGLINNADPLQHAHGGVLEIGGYLYVFSVDGHGENMLIWKSNSIENVSGGFTLHDTITGDFGYANAMYKNNRMIILTRSTNPVGTPNMSHVILYSDENDFTTWTEKTVTDADYSVTADRHYPALPYHYGTNTWYYFGVQIRQDSGGSGYMWAQCIYKTQDFVNYYSLDENFSKDIDISGEITQAELLSNCAIFQAASKTVVCSGLNGIILNDEYYGSFYDTDESKWKWVHIDSSGTQTETDIPLTLDAPTISTPLAFNMMYYNGQNLVHKINENIYKSRLDFSDLELIDGVDFDERKIIPLNLDEVTGEYMMGGSLTEGDFYYNITSNKFLIA